jgi:SAM-dependent methyltransferase
VNRDLALEWFDRWERQQELYAIRRTDRFEVICDVLRAAPEPPRLVIDLGCGPGSLAAVVSHTFPDCRVVGIDIDPFLLALGSSVHPEIDFRRADLADPGWADGFADQCVSAVVTSTALHYPSVPILAGIYQRCASLLRPGGMFVNGDHLVAETPGLQSVATVIGARADDVEEGRDTWAQWWEGVADQPEFAELLARRVREMPAHVADNDLTADQHREIMLDAGFVEAGSVWQVGVSTVMVGVARTV